MKYVLPDHGYNLMLVTDRTRSRLPLPELVRLAVEGGVNAVQIREKDLVESELIDLAGQVLEVACDKAWVVVNGSLGAAETLGIGVHLPERGQSIEHARGILGKDAIIGRSVHSVHEAAHSEGADYLIAGPVYATRTKPDVTLLPLEQLGAIANVTSAPVFAIGGIDAKSAPDSMTFGALGVAVIGAISEADDPRAAAAEIRKALDAHAAIAVR